MPTWMIGQVELSRPQMVLFSALLYVGPLVSIGIGWAVGIFRRPGIVGPERLEEGEPVLRVMGILLLGIVTYILIPGLYAQSKRAGGAADSVGAATVPTTVETRPTATAGSELSGLELVGVTAVGGVSALGVMLVANVLVRPGGLRGLGLSIRAVPKGIGMGIVGTLFVLPLMVWVGAGTNLLWELLGVEHPKKHELLEMLGKGDDPLLRVLIVISAVVLAPVSEEVLFRGHLQTGLAAIFTRRSKSGSGFRDSGPGFLLPDPGTRIPEADVPPIELDERRQTAGRWVAVVIASLAFAVVHPWWTMPAIFFLSVCLGFAYERTGNLYAAIVMHALFNGTSVLVSQYVVQ